MQSAVGKLTLLAASLVSCSTSAEELWAILPGDFVLDGPSAQQRLVVEQVDHANRFIGPVSEKIEFVSSNPDVARIENGVAVPISNGETIVTAAAGEKSASTIVTVTGMERTMEWSFRNHVQSILTKSGCNSGACHGALAGKGGLKLSLRGYDPLRDWNALTRQARGRRIELADPGRSLILAKPSGAIPHKGGVRFEVGSQNYDVLAKWVAVGAGPPQDSDPRIDRIEMLPESVVLSKGSQQPFLVRAYFTDGRAEDVTHWAKFTSSNETVAAVDDNGMATVVGHGEGAVSAWYLSKLVLARIATPYSNKPDAKLFIDSPRRNFIDELVFDKLASLNLPPSPLASDEEFLRRIYLDTIGTLPTADEVSSFNRDVSPDKRDKLIDALLARPEFVDYWAYKWSDLLLVTSQQLRPMAVGAYYDWIRKCVAENKPWDRIARELVTAVGDTFENGATNFYTLHQDPESMTESVCVAFLGLNINCARCHNHPLEKWTNDQYYAMANLFGRVRAKGWGGDALNGDGRRTVYTVTNGELMQPSTRRPQLPTPLDGQPLTQADPTDRRIHLANWLTSPDNPYFARAITNRVWANFFAVGLVEPVDDLRVSNPASNEELLSATAKYLVDNNYDLKVLMRAILQSHTYQRSSQPIPENKDETRFYSRYYPRRLMAEVLLDAISQVTATPSEFTHISYGAGEKLETKEYQPGTRALQLRDSAVVSQFLKTFGRNDRMITCECGRSSEPNMVQVLHLSNGETINQKLAAKNNRIDQLLAAGKSNYEIVEDLYLSSLARRPSDAEMLKVLQELAVSPDVSRRQMIEDVYWSVLSSGEFLLNH